MSDDRRRTEQYASLRDERLRSWISDVVYPHSAAVREQLQAARLDRTAIRTSKDLGRLAVTPVADLGDGRRFVLRPTAESIARFGPLADQVRLRVADAFGRRPELGRDRIDPAHKPVLWTAASTGAGTLFTASTSVDLDRLAAIGRRALFTSGVREQDRVVMLGLAGPAVGPWQLSAGCREAGVQLLRSGDGDVAGLVTAAAPTVVAGRGADLADLARAGLPSSVRLLIRHDGPRTTDDERDVLDGTGLPLAEWWAPVGVRAAWVRCPGGVGYHTWPTDELVEVIGPDGRPAAEGRLVWSAVGWHGSVWLRVAPGPRARLHGAPCPSCGRTSPRVEPIERPSWAEELDRSPTVDEWLGVRRTDGSVVLLVTPSAEATDGLGAALTERLGMRVVAVGASRCRKARQLAGGADVVDEAVVAPALTRSAR